MWASWRDSMRMRFVSAPSWSSPSLGSAQVPAAADAFVSGMRTAMLAAGALTLLAALLTVVARRRPDPA